jgi:hypothetical protein
MTRMMSIRCTLCNKNDVDPSYILRLEIEGKDHPVTTLSSLSPSSIAFVFVALDQHWRHWQGGEDKDSSNGDGDGDGDGGSNGGVVAVKGGGGWICHHPQRQLGGGGVVLWQCPPTRVYHPMMRTHTTTTMMQ